VMIVAMIRKAARNSKAPTKRRPKRLNSRVSHFDIERDALSSRVFVRRTDATPQHQGSHDPERDEHRYGNPVTSNNSDGRKDG